MQKTPEVDVISVSTNREGNGASHIQSPALGHQAEATWPLHALESASKLGHECRWKDGSIIVFSLGA